jgi:hypothetical protein
MAFEFNKAVIRCPRVIVTWVLSSEDERDVSLLVERRKKAFGVHDLSFLEIKNTS